jgi:hydrogenase maturation protease
MSPDASGRMLLAGVGNVFRGDDGFGVQVALRLRNRSLPEWVRVGDFGSGGLHLAFELLEGYETTVLIDALPRGGAPGTVYLLEPDPADSAALAGKGPDGHGMDAPAVLALLNRMGGDPGRLLVVGCEPVWTDEHLGLSEPVAAAVEVAVGLIEELVAHGAPARAPDIPGTNGG